MLTRSLRRLYEEISFDLVIVGAGPAGLACAIQAKKLQPDLSVCVLEKGAAVGNHIISGNIFETRALTELFPDWRNLNDIPVKTQVTSDVFKILSENSSLQIPGFLLPPELRNENNFIISLGELCRFLSAEAELIGVEIFPGFAAAAPVIKDGRLVGVVTRDTGVAKDGSKRPNYAEGVAVVGKQVVLAEGAKGSVTTKVIEQFALDKDSCPQSYSIGFKEVWEVPHHSTGHVMHTVGWPLALTNYGGGFIYFKDDNQLLLGLVVGLDYKDPFISPYELFQRWKLHPDISKILKGGKCVSYGARVIGTGGLQALPELQFPGGLLAGCAAGFLNVPKIKGSHLAIKSGMLAAEAALAAMNMEKLIYKELLKKSWLWEELQQVRNCKPSFKAAGLLSGLPYSAVSLFLKGKEPWTFKWGKRDAEYTESAALHAAPARFKADNVTTFPLLDNLARTGVAHEHDQPSHLKVKDDKAPELSYANFAAPESRFCPAGVYEYPEPGKLVINAQNCIHCKTCAIKTPFEFIEWTVPEGGGGPNYEAM